MTQPRTREDPAFAKPGPSSSHHTGRADEPAPSVAPDDGPPEELIPEGPTEQVVRSAGPNGQHGPRTVRVVGGFDTTLHIDGLPNLRIHLDEPNRRGEGIATERLVVEQEGQTLLLPRPLDFTDDRAMLGFSTLLEKVTGKRQEPWVKHLSAIALQVRDEYEANGYTGKKRAVKFGDLKEFTRPSLVLDGMVVDGQFNIRYGLGGAGKGVTSMNLAIMAARAGKRVLVIDYEGHEEEWWPRFNGLTRDAPDSEAIYDHLGYLNPRASGYTGPFWNRVDDYGIELDGYDMYILDSITRACAAKDEGDLLQMKTVQNYADAVEMLGLTSVHLGHTSREGLHIFGSQGWPDAARGTVRVWRVGRLSKEGLHVARMQRMKTNNSFTGDQLDAYVTYDGEDPVQVELKPVVAASISERILDEVEGVDGAWVDIDKMAERVKGTSDIDSVKRKVRNLTGDGQPLEKSDDGKSVRRKPK